jgi:hypothetical protein
LSEATFFKLLPSWQNKSPLSVSNITFLFEGEEKSKSQKEK